MEIHNPGKFHRYSICACRVMHFQSCLYQQKAGCLAAFGWFFVDYNPKSTAICTKFSPVMQSNSKYGICYGFCYSAENSKKWSQKTNFGPFFQWFFGHALPRPMGNAKIFFQMKGLMMIHDRGKFDLHSICGSQVINFQKFSWQCSIHKLGHFGGFLGPKSPKYGRILLKLVPEVVFKEKQAVFS